MSYNTSIVVTVLIMIGGMWLAFALETHTKGEVLKACYEAAKTNTNIKCEEKK